MGKESIDIYIFDNIQQGGGDEEGVLSPKEPKERLSKQESVVELKGKGSDADLHLFWE